MMYQRLDNFHARMVHCSVAWYSILQRRTNRLLSQISLFPSLCSVCRCSGYPTWFTVATNGEDPIMVEWVLYPLRNALPMVVCTKHPVLINICGRVKVDVKMSCHGLRNHGRQQDTFIGFCEVPICIATSRTRSERVLMHLVLYC